MDIHILIIEDDHSICQTARICLSRSSGWINPAAERKDTAD